MSEFDVLLAVDDVWKCNQNSVDVQSVAAIIKYVCNELDLRLCLTLDFFSYGENIKVGQLYAARTMAIPGQHVMLMLVHYSLWQYNGVAVVSDEALGKVIMISVPDVAQAQVLGRDQQNMQSSITTAIQEVYNSMLQHQREITWVPL